jgi:large subunit ribosomal protein L32
MLESVTVSLRQPLRHGSRIESKGPTMPVPKRKTGKAVRDSRRSHDHLTGPALSECPQCHKPKVPHRVCPSCGYYRGQEVVEID